MSFESDPRRPSGRPIVPTFVLALALSLVALSGPSARPAYAGAGDCGQPTSSTPSPTASDALFVLRAAVSLDVCLISICDVDGSCTITAGDALRVLRKAVGVAVELACTCNVTTTSTSTSTTTSTSSTTTSTSSSTSTTSTSSTTSTTSTTLPEIPFWPADAGDYVAGPLAYMDSIAVPAILSDGMGGVPECCKDYGPISKDSIEDGTDEPDNALARLAPFLAGAGIDFDVELNNSIQDGSLVLLLDHQFLDLDGGSGLVARGLPDDEFALVQLTAAYAAGTTFAEASAGLGEFVILRDTFLPGTGEPTTFAFPSMLAVDLMGTLDPFELGLALSFGILNLDLRATLAEVTAVPGSVSADGISYTEATLSGVVVIDDIFEGFNSVLSSPQCDCLGLSEDVYTQAPDGSWSGACVADGAALCPGEEQAACATLAGRAPGELCLLLAPVLDAAADINLEGDATRYEGMSIGLTFTAVEATSVGVEPAP